MFGAVNSLFSGLAFAGLIFTILLQRGDLALQRRELVLQRRELTLTRVELERSAEAQERSGRALTAQLQASAISAQLAAVALLIDEKIQHLSTEHQGELHSGVAAALTVETIKELMARAKSEAARGNVSSPRAECFVSDCEAFGAKG